MDLPSRVAACALVAAAVVAAPSVPGARADDAPLACDSWDIDYALAANVQLSDTMLGAGDGVHRIGPGRVVLHVESRDGLPAGRVRMLSYEMRDVFTVDAKALFWATHVTNQTRTTVTPDATGSAAEGTLASGKLRWATAVSGMRTDGTVTCEGSLCGRFGAPPSGTSDVHTPPHPVTFNTFDFDADGRTFTMPYAVVSRFESPRQTSRITLAGRETKRTCTAPKDR